MTENTKWPGWHIVAWGSCDDCPRDEFGRIFPEHCINRARHDHFITVEPRGQVLERCPTCKEVYSEPPTERAMLCSRSFHCCRACVWNNGRVVIACALHTKKQKEEPEPPPLGESSYRQAATPLNESSRQRPALPHGRELPENERFCYNCAESQLPKRTVGYVFCGTRGYDMEANTPWCGDWSLKDHENKPPCDTCDRKSWGALCGECLESKNFDAYRPLKK